MWKVIETGALWACLPFVALAILAGLLNAPWATVAIIVLVPASPLIVGFIYGVLTYDDSHARRQEQTRRRQATDQVHRALLPGRPDDVIR